MDKKPTARGKGKAATAPQTLGGLGGSTRVPAHQRGARLLDAGHMLGGTYQIGELIGEGGMGQVYEARDVGLGRTVAIKVAWPDLGPDSLVREAQAMAAFHDPGLMEVLAMGLDGGVRFVVMERLYGRTLEQHIEQRARFGEFSIAEVVHILGGICRSVHSLHEARLAHRDLKPANLILAAHRVVLLDFGILHAEARLADEKTIAGTPEYLAPEVGLGRMKPGEAFLADLYALGVIGYQMLTGQLPFSESTPVATISSHIHAPRPNPTSLRPDTPDELAALIVDLLAQDPADRPPSMEAVAVRLRLLGWQLESMRAEPLSILIAEDDEHMRKRLTQLVQSCIPHSAVHSAVDGEDAQRAFAQMPTDIILIDLQLPKINGIELAMYLRGTSLADATHFVIVSAFVGPAERALARRLGIRHFVNKGPTLDEELRQVLAKVVATTMHARSSRRRLRDASK